MQFTKVGNTNSPSLQFIQAEWRCPKFPRHAKQYLFIMSSPLPFQIEKQDIFLPLTEASKNPDSHPYVAKLLEKVTSFDIVDDEGQLEANITVTYLTQTFSMIV